MASSFIDRFRQLEIPEEKRRVDWTFLDETLALPGPLPLEAQPIVAVIDGKLYEPQDAAPTRDSLFFYGAPVALETRATATVAETAWRGTHDAELQRLGSRFIGTIPTDVLRDRADEALSILELNAPTPNLFDGQRLLRVHDKLYNLQSLHEYTRIFEKAIDPELFRQLQALPPTCTPAEMLAAIAQSLPKIHKKARSPLRNKMECTRLVVGGVTYLPVYREPSAGLFTAYRKLLERRIKIEVLARHAHR
jgi:hypothetical protein